MKHVPRRDRRFPDPNAFSVRMAVAVWLAILGGCQGLKSPVDVTQPPGLNWLSQFVPAEQEVGQSISIEQLRAPEAAAVVHEGDVLELTIWDLYEPGIPHTSPLRIDEVGSADPPLLSGVQLGGLTLGEVEKLLIDKYQGEELLLRPRIMVRRLETSSCAVQVLGGVVHAGSVKLPHDQATVYHAVLAAGGLMPHTSSNWMLTRYPPQTPNDLAEEITQPEAEQADAAGEEGETLVSTLDTSALRTPTEERTFDLSKPQEMQELKRIQLREGDVLRIPESSPPLRISGVVRRPGSYPMQGSQSLSIREAIDLSGGLLLPTFPGQGVVTRPIPGSPNVERWTFPIVKGAAPDDAPELRPGDNLHIEVSPHAQVKRVLGGLRHGSAPSANGTDHKKPGGEGEL